MPDGVKISYILNEARVIWHASWLLEVTRPSGHRFETSRHENFVSAKEAREHLSRQFDEPIAYLNFYNQRK